MDENQLKEQLISMFHLHGSLYREPYPFHEGIGFSTTREYSEQEKAAMSGVRTEDLVCLIYIAIHDQVQQDESKELSIVLQFSFMKRIDDGHYQYPSIEDKTFKQPINLEMNDVYWSPKEKLIHYEGRSLSGLELLNEAFNLHLAPLSGTAGLRLRARLYFHREMPKRTYKTVSKFLVYFYVWYSGKKMERDNVKRSVDFYLESKQPSREPANPEKLEVSNYRASSRIIMGYTSAHLLYYISAKINLIEVKIVNEFGREIGSNNILTVLYLIGSLYLYDVLFGRVLLKIIKVTTERSLYAGERKIVIK